MPDGRRRRRTVAIVQARTGSTRLPGKVLMDLAGEPMLARVVHRLARAESLDAVWVATTTESSDDAIESLCSEQDWPVFRGSEHDVLDRYRAAAIRAGADVIVRVTSDCPLIDAGVVDQVVAGLSDTNDYSSNVVPIRTFPRGLDTEAFRSSALETAWTEARSPSEREHVTSFIWQRPGRFPQASITADADYSRHRWTVDTTEDYALVERIFDHFGADTFSWQDVLRLVSDNPDWYSLNAHVEQKLL